MLSLLLCAVCFVCLWLMYARARELKAHALPPALPGAFPVVGHAYMVLKNSIWNIIRNSAEHCAKQGGVTYVKIGSDLYYLIVDPQDALTAANSCLQKHFGFAFAKDWMGDGLITASVPIWKRHRRLLSPAFTLPVVHGFLEIFNCQSKRLLSDMDSHAGKGLFNHSVQLRSITLETLCVGAFGINPIEDKDFTQKYMKSVDEILALLTERITKVWLHSNLMYRLSGLKKKEEELVETLDRMCEQVLQRKKAEMKDKLNLNNNEYKTTGIKNKQFLDLLLELSADGTMTDKEIREEIDTTVAAGFETTSNQLTFTLFLIGAHPEVQAKMYEEVLEVLGPDRDLEKDDINKLVYTNAVLMECLRLFPSVPALPRYVDRDVKLKNYTMRAGSQCIIFPLCTRLDPAWGTASENFRPERWLNYDVTCSSKEFAAFGLGKRACLGRTYAIISMKVVLAHFIRRYRVSADMSQLQLQYTVVLKPVSGYEISIERRI